MHRRWMVLIGVAACLLAGCGATRTAGRSSRTIGSTVGEVTGTAIGHQYGERAVGRSVGSKLGGLAGEVAGSALETHRQPPSDSAQATKFCPVGGEWYPSHFVFCPIHGAELRQRR